MQQYLIFIIILASLVSLVLIINKKQKYLINESNFIISMKLLDILIDDYCIFYLNTSIEKLKKSYDLDENSQTNAFKQFNQDYITLLNNATKSIIHEYLSPTIKQELLIYFSIDSLVLYIVNQLREKSKLII